MKPTYSDAGKLAWYPDIACPVCGGDVNSWDKRCSRALGYNYRQIFSGYAPSFTTALYFAFHRSTPSSLYS